MTSTTELIKKHKEQKYFLNLRRLSRSRASLEPGNAGVVQGSPNVCKYSDAEEGGGFESPFKADEDNRLFHVIGADKKFKLNN